MKADLDCIDLQLLTLLQHDCRLSNKELADKLGITATPVLMRRRKLEEQGYISKYMAVVDRNKIDLSLVAYTNVQLSIHSRSAMTAFEKSVMKFEEVMECHHMTGSYDYLLKIVLKDMNAYHHFIREKLATLPNIHTVQSSFVMTEVKMQLSYKLHS
ncbi:Lrp/AsnC family transcriptional regulator [Pseudoflavitalea sp. G-6-1-2]|uniref:Lrp/AsnC family transcriptional regulator n=1 Tax=Pseudoflavitalea sp. G-6-1-2 TaxID=2728841 RepID=UPI00146F7D61|nr:Lrp/AsnC family transcriptional regulator [Pseudoflavitalea sp. G-6-1-2]NML20712.1 Lrp/AsnC family transcriptional regulator [Pseudoflavitalea sp. G-6-1-2]